jgi:hypothetical protein
MPAWKRTFTVLGVFLGVVFWTLVILASWLMSGDDLGKAIFAGSTDPAWLGGGGGIRTHETPHGV